MTRVLSTAAAHDAIAKMHGIIGGGLLDQISQLGTQGQFLSQPDVWDGAAAAQFRTTWDQTHRALLSTREQLEALRVQIDRINTNIMMAGGNA